MVRAGRRVLNIPNMAPATGGYQVTRTQPAKGHEKGWTLSIPFWSKPIRDVDEGMRKYIWMAFAVDVALFLIVVFIVMGAFLSPGVIDPETGKVRFVSDGFKVRAVSMPSSACLLRHRPSTQLNAPPQDHRWLPRVCNPLIAVLGLVYAIFVKDAAKAVRAVEAKQTLFVALSGLFSYAGFWLVQEVVDGPVHLTGAAVFISGQILMHWFVDDVLWKIRGGSPGDKSDRLMEHGIKVVMSMAALAFAGLMILSIAMGGPYSSFFFWSQTPPQDSQDLAQGLT